MYIIIVGGGEVGFYLAKEFIEGGHEVLVIEPDPKQRERLEEELGEISLSGEGCRIQCLDEAGVSRADLFIAATNADENNLAACQLAKLKYRVPRVVSKLNNPRNRNIFRKLGIEITVDVAALVLENLKARIPVFPLVRVLSLEDEDMDVVQVRITESSPLRDKKLGETAVAFLAEAACLVRAGSGPQVAGESTRLLTGDSLICVVLHDKVDKLRAEVGDLGASAS
ncbi:MAG: TrkA family potassium uptake protein [Dehalococcoidia bacterium]|nr:MAG: TrkA family potassium uptake protein [Dehalococcoidia bacterium]